MRALDPRFRGDDGGADRTDVLGCRTHGGDGRAAITAPSDSDLLKMTDGRVGRGFWIPASAGMTDALGCRTCGGLTEWAAMTAMQIPPYERATVWARVLVEDEDALAGSGAVEGLEGLDGVVQDVTVGDEPVERGLGVDEETGDLD